MNTKGLLLALLAVVVLVAASESDVASLTQADFDSTLASNDFVYVKFFAPWCGHCKSMAEDYKKLATDLKGTAVIAEVDCTQETAVCDRYGVKGYPTVKMFVKGELASDYKGQRNLDAMKTFVLRSTQPPAQILESAEAVKAFVAANANQVAVVGFAASGSTDLNKFEGAAREISELAPNVAFGIVSSADLLSEVHGGASDAIVVVRDGSSSSLPFSDDLTQKLLIASLPTVSSFGSENAQLYSKAGVPLLLTFASDASVFPAAVTEVAPEFRGKLAAVVMDAAKYGRFVEHLGLKEATLPATVIHNMNDDVTYQPSSQPLDAAALREFASAFAAGTLKPTVKSEEAPADNSAPVKVVVGTTFADIVMNSEKDVLLEQYAPWCGHCKNLVPIYDDLASTLSSIPTVTIAKMDSTKNDAPAGYKARSFPTLHFFPAGADKKGIAYSGARTKEAFLAFIQEHATHKFDLPAGATTTAPKADGKDEL